MTKIIFWKRWVQNDRYKLFDTNINVHNYRFVKVTKCLPDSPPLTNLTPEEQQIRNEFIDVLRNYDDQ